MASRSRIFEQCADDAFELLEDFASAPTDDVREISASKKAERERVMRKWNKFFNELYTKKKQVDPEGVWLGMCCDDEEAKMHCKIFLQWYIKSSGRLEVCLGPAEREWKREVKSAITVTEVWKCLVVEADSTVLFRKRKEDRANRRKWILAFAEKDRTGPVAEISRWIAGPMARQYDLTTEQMFVKQETTAEDIAVFLDALWTRSGDIPLTPTKRIAFHAYVLVVGIGGFRNSSVLGLPYKQVRFALVRDPDNSGASKLVAHVLIIQNKRRKTLRRTQDDRIEFTITFVPGRTVCLLSQLAARAVADDAFQGGYQTLDELLYRPHLEPGIDYLPLPLKNDVLDKPIIPLYQEKLNEIWNRTLLVSGLRQTMKPYSLRVGAANRLNGVLEPALRNYILSHSSGMFQHSYQPRHFGHDLSMISFGKLGSDGDEKLFKVLCNASLARDERAPVDPTAEDLAGFAQRRDIQALYSELRDASDAAARRLITSRIAHIVKILSRLRVQELREAYFAEADRRRGHGLPTDDLAQPPVSANTPATRVGQFLRLEKSNLSGGIKRPHLLAKLLLDFLRNQLSPLSDADTALRSDSKSVSASTGFEATTESTAISSEPAIKPPSATCLLCLETCANRSSLTRHHKRRHLLVSFQQPFPCPECQRQKLGDFMIDGAPAWSNHVETYHGRDNTPNLPRKTQLWHESVVAVSQEANCLICRKSFLPGKGFATHMRTHKDKGIFSKPFNCVLCTEDTRINGLRAWIDHSVRCHGGCPESGAVLGNPTAGLKRAYDDDVDTVVARQAKMGKVENSLGDRAVTAAYFTDDIPIDPALYTIVSSA